MNDISKSKCLNFRGMCLGCGIAIWLADDVVLEGCYCLKCKKEVEGLKR